MPERPLMRDFMGLNVHTVLFRPDLYQPVTRVVRDYHGLDWDIGEDTSYVPQFPMSRNKVNWLTLYGEWVKKGYEIDVCVMLGNTPPNRWKDLKKDSYQYGREFARYFGPSGVQKLAASVEIGNEPGEYPDDVYRTLFENMARGIRAGDPRLKIVTCATFDQPSGKYHKGIEVFKGLDSIYDVLNVHSYAQVEGYPTWRRSYPEDPKIPYLKDVQKVIDWRNRYGKGKPVWVTEFGWDATTKPNEKAGTFKDWVGVTDLQQAQYIVRSFLVFSAMDVERAYLFFFNDDDKASVHAAAGLTRNYKQKPSFYATAYLLQTLGEYRFGKIVEATPERYVYEYQHGKDKSRRIRAVWSPTGSGRKAMTTLTKLPGKVEKVERMPLSPGAVELVRGEMVKEGARVPLEESPVFVFLRG